VSLAVLHFTRHRVVFTRILSRVRVRGAEHGLFYFTLAAGWSWLMVPFQLAECSARATRRCDFCRLAESTYRQRSTATTPRMSVAEDALHILFQHRRADLLLFHRRSMASTCSRYHQLGL
jgi:alpha-tubulin suppressor-like RCC1 family protein